MSASAHMTITQFQAFLFEVNDEYGDLQYPTVLMCTESHSINQFLNKKDGPWERPSFLRGDTQKDLWLNICEQTFFFSQTLNKNTLRSN